jgi:hypothetical protein
MTLPGLVTQQRCKPGHIRMEILFPICHSLAGAALGPHCANPYCQEASSPGQLEALVADVLDLVADAGGLFELQVFGCLEHFLFQAGNLTGGLLR